MARRGEGQFVALEVNLRNDPKVLAFARTLKISKLEALGYIAVWREFVLTKGTGAGVIKGYTRAEIAAFFESTKQPAQLVAALRSAGMLTARRGAFVHPGWPDTPTGYYASKRAHDRARQADRWRSLRGDSAESPRSEHGDSTEAPADPGQEVSKGLHGAPPGAPQGGAPQAATRLEWFEDNYPKGLVETAKCAALLAELSDAEWSHLQFAVGTQARSVWWRERGRAPKPERWLEQREWKRVKLPRAPRKAPEVDEAARAAKAAEAEKLRKEEEARAAATKAWLDRRAEVRHKLREEGLRGEELENRLDQEMQRLEQQLAATGGAPAGGPN